MGADLLDPDELRIEVANNGLSTASGTGYGQAGMRERVRLYGGRVESGPRPDGGYVVRAFVPIGSGGMSAPIRVLIADDQPMVRAGLRMILELEPDIDIVGEAADGNEAVAVAAATEPDVILMDVRMPNLDGLEATRRIVGSREDGPRVLILTTFDLDVYVYEALASGASGFVLKDIEPEKLVDAIRVIANGEALLSPTVTKKLIEEFVRRPPDVVRPVAAGARAADRAGGRDHGAGGPRPVQRRDRGPGVRERADRQDPRRPDPHEARAARPRPGGRLRLRARPREARQLADSSSS